MVTPAHRLHQYTYEQYLALERDSVIRHEYLDGEIYAMAGGTPDHAALAATVIRLLGSQLPRGCRIYTSDLRVRIPSTGLSTYPDASVICGPTRRSSDDTIAVINPSVLVEVTSDSTEQYDRGEKLQHYQQLPTVVEIVLVSHREPRLTLHRRQGENWTTTERRAGETIELSGISARLTVDDVYRDGLEDVERAAG